MNLIEYYFWVVKNNANYSNGLVLIFILYEVFKVMLFSKTNNWKARCACVDLRPPARIHACPHLQSPAWIRTHTPRSVRGVRTHTYKACRGFVQRLRHVSRARTYIYGACHRFVRHLRAHAHIYRTYRRFV